ncbi:hypothetical protein AB2D15_31240 [Pseudomonas aeruginosa]
MDIHLQGTDPRVDLAHFEHVIEAKRNELGEGGTKIPKVLLLEPEDRKRYLMCQAAVKHFEAKKGTCGIHTLQDMVEHLELVNELSLSQAKVPVEDLRKFSLDLLRSMRTGLAKRA